MLNRLAHPEFARQNEVLVLNMPIKLESGKYEFTITLKTSAVEQDAEANKKH